MLHTVYEHVGSNLHREGGEGELNQREGERGSRSQSWVENTSTKMTECTQEIGYLQSIKYKL
jgi:hypothetical protein